MKFKLPEAFEKRMIQQLLSEFPEYVKEFLIPPHTSIRNNPSKPFLKTIKKTVDWAKEGEFLESRPRFNHEPLWHAGAYYVQEASSMFIEQFIQHIDLGESPIVLDLCAAPGGKSTHLLSLIPKDALLIANEIISKRNHILQENLIKWGYSNYIVTQNSPEQFGKLNNFFDLVVLDAPCSGEGLFKKDPDAMLEWSEEHVESCSIRQSKIIEAVLPSIRMNGYLIYSTCTYSLKENENQIQRLLDTGNWQLVTIDISSFQGVINGQNNIGYRFYPHKVKGEGFYIACLKKIAAFDEYRNQESSQSKMENISSSIDKVTSEAIDIISEWIKKDKNYTYFNYHKEIIAFPENHQSLIDSLWNRFNITRFGILIGEIVHGKLIPNHHLALSQLLIENIPYIEVDENTAIQYLEKKTILLPIDAKLGWNLIKYKNVNLGWIKILSNRMNNYYPKNWSIKNYKS